MSKSAYQPHPIDTSKVMLTPEIAQLIETLSPNTHEVWTQKRVEHGWTYAKLRDDARGTV